MYYSPFFGDKVNLYLYSTVMYCFYSPFFSDKVNLYLQYSTVSSLLYYDVILFTRNQWARQILLHKIYFLDMIVH